MKKAFKILSVAVLAYQATLVFAANPSKLPRPNPYLAADILSITHVDSAATDSFPWSMPEGIFHINLSKTPQVIGGPVNIMTLASTSLDYMWGVSSGGVTYIDKKGGNWKEVARISVPGIQPVTAELNKQALGHRFKSVQDIENSVKNIYKMEGFSRITNGVYSVVDKNNVLYVKYTKHLLYAFGLKNPNNPAAGIKIIKSLDLNTISKDRTEALAGVSMTYDGYLILLGSRSLTIVNRNLDKVLAHVEFGKNEYISNSVAVDDKNGIYVASNQIMRKVVWTGHTLSTDEKDGAWSSPYDTGSEPLTVKFGTGTGSTPSLMGFDKDHDQLVVITDGANQMNLVAFWRNGIPKDAKQQPGARSRRIAGKIKVTCGFKKLPPFIQSEQSVVVKDYGAFVVNNSSIEGNKDLLVGVIGLGPIFPAPHGVERFEWDPKKHQWSSVWANPNIVSISMVPVVSRPSNMVLVNGYTKSKGWEITGLNWNTGKIVHRTFFGQTNYGNGAYALLELLPDNNFIFNSIAGPYRIIYTHAQI